MALSQASAALLLHVPQGGFDRRIERDNLLDLTCGGRVAGGVCNRSGDLGGHHFGVGLAQQGGHLVVEALVDVGQSPFERAFDRGGRQGLDDRYFILLLPSFFIV